MKHEVMVIVLGGGQGTRLYPLTLVRSKPAVPIGGKYRLIDIPVSNCLHADLRSIFVLTQFNSASLNRHIAQTYRLDQFSHGFVEILAAEQTPEGNRWFQGTADAVRQARRHFAEYKADYYLILAGDHIYRMDYAQMIESHVERKADVTIAAHPVSVPEAPSMGIFLFDKKGRIAGFEEKPSLERLGQLGSSAPAGSAHRLSDDKPFMASMGIYVFSRATLFELLDRHSSVDFGKEIIPASLSTHNVLPYFFDGYWVDVGTLQSFYEANIQLTEPGAAFNFYHPTRPIYTHQRFLPGSRFNGCAVNHSIVAEGCFVEACTIENSVMGIRTTVRAGSKITRSVLLGADFYEVEGSGSRTTASVPLGIGRDVTLDRVIVDKNARIGDGVRLVNERGLEEAQGDGYVIRNGLVIVPKGAVVRPGTTC